MVLYSFPYSPLPFQFSTYFPFRFPSFPLHFPFLPCPLFPCRSAKISRGKMSGGTIPPVTPLESGNNMLGWVELDYHLHFTDMSTKTTFKLNSYSNASGFFCFLFCFVLFCLFLFCLFFVFLFFVCLFVCFFVLFCFVLLCFLSLCNELWRFH